MTEIRQPLNAPLTLELNGFLVDDLAAWARLDGQVMRTTDTADHLRLNASQRIKAETLMASLVSLVYVLGNLNPDSDLAVAIAERDAAYDAHRPANAKA